MASRNKIGAIAAALAMVLGAGAAIVTAQQGLVGQETIAVPVPTYQFGDLTPPAPSTLTPVAPSSSQTHPIKEITKTPATPKTTSAKPTPTKAITKKAPAAPSTRTTAPRPTTTSTRPTPRPRPTSTRTSYWRYPYYPRGW